MHFQFLIEDSSSGILIDSLMEKFEKINPDFTYDSITFKGIGGFTKKNTVKETKTGKLLNDLATYLRGFNKSFKEFDAAIIVILDNDDNDTAAFRSQLMKVSLDNRISVDHVFCIAVEEVEAWLLGDEGAIARAYPSYKANLLHSYVQDSICGTWETLADVVFNGGINKIRKEKYTYIEIGALKSEWAKNIGRYMDLTKNKSDSFNTFVKEIENRLR